MSKQSSAKSLNKLQNLHKPLLLAELAAWLHMFGKLHEDFLAGNHDLDTQIPDDAPDELKGLLTGQWVRKIWKSIDDATPQLQARNITISTFIRNHRKKPANSITGLLQDAHGRGSGIEKGALNRFAPGQQGNVVLSSAMGNETTPIDLPKIQAKRQKLYSLVITLLEKARAGDTPLSRKEADKIRECFEITAADTRRPLNDVTLYDQTAATVALFKASLAQVLLTGWKDPSLQGHGDKYQWRILRVGFNGPLFWGNARGISDLLARKDLVGGVLDRVREQLEQDCPLGSEVYRDENGSLFIVPDIADLLHFTLEEKTLADTLQEIAADILDGEARLELELSEPSRGLKKFGELVVKPLAPPAPEPAWLQTAWQNVTPGQNREICTVCGLRPQKPDPKSQKRKTSDPPDERHQKSKVCGTCEKRRQKRSKGWAQNLGDRSSIWMSEIADDNGRLALLVGQFGLEHWLSGEALNSVMMMDPLRRRLVDERRDEQGNKVRHEFEFDYTQLLADCRLAEHNPNSPLDAQQAELLDNLMLDISRGNTQNLGKLYDLYISDTGLHTPAGREGWRLALALMRQQPSFARIRRVWETTLAFWRAVEQDLLVSVGQAGPRLQITGRFSGLASAGLGEFHAYELVPLRGGKLNAVWDAKNERFISADNLERAARLMGREDTEESPPGAQFLQENLRGATLKIQEPGGYGSTAKLLGSLENAALEPIPESEYIPAIVILAEPRTFMALVPAGKAPSVIAGIRQRYQNELGKVTNRLPLRLGMAFAPQHTPVRALLDAGRRMLRGDPLPIPGWEMAESAGNGEVILQRNGRQIRWRAPLVMGGGSPDVWYPYAYLQEEAPGTRQRRVLASNPWSQAATPAPLVHFTELKPGDRVYFTPSSLDFIWLGSAAQRFEIAYAPQGGRFGLPRRPYLFDELDHLEDIWQAMKAQLSKNQIYILRDVIETRRESWYAHPEEALSDPVFRQFCRDALRNAEWRHTPWQDEAGLDRWVAYARRGWLADAVELHLHILKEKIEQQPQSQTQPEEVIHE